ncbi:MAG: GTPase Era [Gammaproteobacteria bacterium]|jgi:GTP-binding protein Era
MNSAAGFRSGLVAVVGRPNVGKSTLINALVGQKVSIVTPKAQTTRHRILGIRSTPESQIVFIDTPGLHGREKKALNRLMNRTARSSLGDADCVLFVIKAGEWREDDELVLDAVRAAGRPTGLIVNQVDRIADKARLLPFIDEVSRRHAFDFVVPISARRGSNLDALVTEVATRLPEGPAWYPEDQVSDRPERFLVAEIVREKLMLHLGQELPYALTVDVEAFAVEGGLTRIAATIWVERDSQKAIVIGSAGRMLKRVGREARLELEKMLETRVFLDLHVKVREGWSDDDRALRSLGYEQQ